MVERRAEILDAAEGVFGERGFQAARIDDIAERIGVAHGTIYSYFASKQELFCSLLEDRLLKLNRSTDGMLHGVTRVDELVDRLVLLHGRFVAAHKRLIDMGFTLLPNFPGDMRARIWGKKEEARRILVEAMRRVLHPDTHVTAEIAADALEGAISNVMFMHVMRRDDSSDPIDGRTLETIQTELKRIIVPGLRSEPDNKRVHSCGSGTLLKSCREADGGSPT